MSSTPQYFDYSIPPSPAFPPVPRVSPASSISSLNSLYEQDGERLQASSYQYSKSSIYEYADSARSAEQAYFSMSKANNGPLFTEDDLAKAFQDRTNVSSRSSPNRLAHDISDP